MLEMIVSRQNLIQIQAILLLAHLALMLSGLACQLDNLSLRCSINMLDL